MKEEKVIFRVGDVTRIVIPKIVKRVGYPKGVDDYNQTVDVCHGEELAKIFYQRTPLSQATRAKVVHELAYMYAKMDKFGGRERSVHLEEIPEMKDQKFHIQRMKTYFEGTYYPGSARGGHEYEDYDPPTLSVSRAVRCAIGLVEKPSCLWSKLEEVRIPVAHLEKVS